MPVWLWVPYFCFHRQAQSCATQRWTTPNPSSCSFIGVIFLTCCMVFPGIRGTSKQISARFVWPTLNCDVHQWASGFIACQPAKVHFHTSSLISSLGMRDARFSCAQADIVGPLSPSPGINLLPTYVDRFTPWPEKISVSDVGSRTVARTFMKHWTSRFGRTKATTNERGAQFDSKSSENFLRMTGIQRIWTTSDHHHAIGLVERFHWKLKTAFSVHRSPQWTNRLPLRPGHSQQIACWHSVNISMNDLRNYRASFQWVCHSWGGWSYWQSQCLR